MTDLKKNNVNDPFSNMNEEKLRSLPVVGVGGLRKFVVKNNIFRGISNLKKRELINDILVSKWWRDNITDKTSKKSDDKSKKSDDESKKDRAKNVDDLSKSLKLRQELQRDLRICEDRIKKRDKSIIERDDEIESLNLLIKKRVDKKGKKSVKKVKKSVKKDKKLDELKDDELKVDELKDDEDSRPNNLQVSDIQDIMGDSKPPIAPPPPPIAPPPPPIAPPPPPKEPISTDSSTQTPPPHTEGLITHQEPQKQNVNAGHTIVNMYCGGNHHPDYPVPQSVVRQALNANQAPLYQQQDIGNFLRDEARNFQQTEPKQSLSDIKSKFNKPAKKFEPVKTITPNKPIDFEKTKRKPERSTQTDDEPPKKSAFEDDDEEEEDEVDRLRRLKREEVARETGKSKGKGFSDAFKRRLEEKLGVKRT